MNPSEHWLFLHAKKLNIKILAVAISCLLYLVAIQAKPLLDDDGFTYLKAAEIFNTIGLTAFIEFYGWPAYPALLSWGDSILPYDIIFAGRCITMLFYALLTYWFIALVSELQPQANKQLQLFAACAILVFPEIAELRHEFLRDPGMWAFGVIALTFLIRYHRDAKTLDAIVCILALALATLFRLEAILLFALAPFTLFFRKHGGSNMPAFLKLALCQISILALILITAFSLHLNLPDQFAYSNRYYTPKALDFFQIFSASAERLSISIYDVKFLSQDIELVNYATLIFAYSFSFILLAARTLGLPFTLILLFGIYKKHLKPSEESRIPLLFFICIPAIYLFSFLFMNQFIVQRYYDFVAIVALSLIVLIVNSIYVSMQSSQRNKRFKQIFIPLFVLLFIDSTISFGANKVHIEQAIAWAEQNVSESQTLYTNNRAIAYFSGKVENYDEALQSELDFLDELKVGDFIIIDIKHSEQKLAERLKLMPDLNLIASFSNSRNDSVFIYRASGED